MTDAPAATIEELTANLTALTAQHAALEKHIRELRAAEDFRAGVTFAKEIFEAQQEKLALATEMEITRRRRKRLTLSI